MILFLATILVVLTAGLFIFAPHRPATPRQVKNLAEMESYLNQLVVVKNGGIVYSQSFGYADALRGEKSTPDTVYHWWSMTKIPTAVAVMQLQERGELGLDDLVTKYLPRFEVKYPSANSSVITIRNLLQHASGLQDTMPAMISWVHYDDATRDQTEIVKKYSPKFNTLKFEPGEEAVYSNFNYTVLGAIVESVSGQPYETYITNNILQPLGMSQTNFVYTPAMTKHEAAGPLPLVHFYTPLLPTLLDINALVRERQGKLLWFHQVYIDATPPTGLIGLAPDVARLMMAYLNRGILDGRRMLNPESVSTLTETAPIDGHGLGWFVSEVNGSRLLEHAGGGLGFATAMRLYPDSGLSIAILANGTDLDRDGLLNLLANMDW